MAGVVVLGFLCLVHEKAFANRRMAIQLVIGNYGEFNDVDSDDFDDSDDV